MFQKIAFIKKTFDFVSIKSIGKKYDLILAICNYIRYFENNNIVTLVCHILLVCYHNTSILQYC